MKRNMLDFKDQRPSYEGIIRDEYSRRDRERDKKCVPLKDKEAQFLERFSLSKLAKELTAAGRERIKPSNFAISEKEPESGSYPIHDISHGRNALARVSQFGSPEEKARVRAAVYAKYPSLRENAEKEKIARLLNQIHEVTGDFHKVAGYFTPEVAEDYLNAGVLPENTAKDLAGLVAQERKKSFILRHPILTGIPSLGIAPAVAKSNALDRIYRGILRHPEHSKLIRGRWAEAKREAQGDRMAEAQARQTEAEWNKAQQMGESIRSAAGNASSAYLLGQLAKYRSPGGEE